MTETIIRLENNGKKQTGTPRKSHYEKYERGVGPGSRDLAMGLDTTATISWLIIVLNHVFVLLTLYKIKSKYIGRYIMSSRQTSDEPLM